MTPEARELAAALTPDVVVCWTDDEVQNIMENYDFLPVAQYGMLFIADNMNSVDLMKPLDGEIGRIGGVRYVRPRRLPGCG